MDDRFSALDGDLMTEALMMEEFNRLVQETPELENVRVTDPLACCGRYLPLQLLCPGHL